MNPSERQTTGDSPPPQWGPGQENCLEGHERRHLLGSFDSQMLLLSGGSTEASTEERLAGGLGPVRLRRQWSCHALQEFLFAGWLAD